jgi:hypothetical protein
LSFDQVKRCREDCAVLQERDKETRVRLARLEGKAEHWVTRDIMRDTIKLYLHDFEVQIRGEFDNRVKEVVSLREKASGGI